MKEEIWSAIEGYEGIYEVSNTGNVRSLNRLDAAGHKRKGVMMKKIKDVYGFYIVTLSKNAVRKTHKIHRLVAQAFIPNPDEKEIVHHINRDTTDNRVENLKWITHQDNIEIHSIPIGIGTNAPRPVIGTNLKTGETVRFKSVRDAGRAGFVQSSVSACCSGRIKQYNGIKWEYENIDKDVA